MTDSFSDFLFGLISDYIKTARKSFQKRIDSWQIDIFEKETNEVIGGLLARQLSLATNIAKCPECWNVHIIPVVLRCMADVYITFCWISKDLKVRSRQFIEYGLGQEKLAIEKYRDALGEDPDPDAIKHVEDREHMLNRECGSYLIPVNLGAWSEMNMRDMAIEVGEKKFYDFVFTQFSAAVHSTWQHVWRINLYPCSNPLHMGHRIPIDTEFPPDLQLFTNSANYLCKTFSHFDAKILGLDSDTDAYECYDLLCERFDKYFNKQQSEDSESNKEAQKNRSELGNKDETSSSNNDLEQ